MGEVLLVLDGDDLGGAMLAAAFRRHGWRTSLLDLRYTKPTLDALSDSPLVRLSGTATEPDVVINRSTTSGLGLASPAALDRQLPETWAGRHLAAREEQGLLLACLDLWDRSSRVYNPVRALDRGLLCSAVALELQAAGVDLLRAGASHEAEGLPLGRPAGRRGACWVVDGTVVEALTQKADGTWRATPMSAGTGVAVAKTADVVGLRLGQVDLWQQRDGRTFVTNWHALPKFRTLWERTGVDIAAGVAAAIVGEARATSPDFLCEDLEPNLLTPPSART